MNISAALFTMSANHLFDNIYKFSMIAPTQNTDYQKKLINPTCLIF